MGRATLIVLVGMFGILSFIQITLNDSSNSITEKTTSMYLKEVSRNIAHTQLNKLMTDISNDNDYRCKNYSQDNVFNGTVRYRVRDTSIAGEDRVVINSIGIYDGVEVSIFAIVNIPALIIPEFMSDYALASNGDCTLNGGFVKNCCDATVNANVYTGGSFQNGAGNNVYGFVHHVGSFSGSKITPPDNPDGDPVHEVVSPKNIPRWKMSDFVSIITQTISGDLTITGPFNLGTLANPEFIKVTGNMQCNTGTEILGYGAFIVEGNVSFNASANIPPMDPDKINVAVYSMQDIDIANGTYANLMFYSNKNFKMWGGDVTGFALAYGTLETKGKFRHKNVEPTLLPSSMTSGGRVRLISLYE